MVNLDALYRGECDAGVALFAPGIRAFGLHRVGQVEFASRVGR